MKFRVWFEQINADYIDVDAIDKEQAIRYAKADRKKDMEMIVTDCRKLKG